MKKNHWNQYEQDNSREQLLARCWVSIVLPDKYTL